MKIVLKNLGDVVNDKPGKTVVVDRIELNFGDGGTVEISQKEGLDGKKVINIRNTHFGTLLIRPEAANSVFIKPIPFSESGKTGFGDKRSVRARKQNKL